jgi:TP901-1 family phage major tail protein
MPAQRGKDILLKLDTTGTRSFVTVAGLRSRRLAFSVGSVDVTNADSQANWRELLASAGRRQASLSGSGVFMGASADQSVLALFLAGTIRAWQVIVPGLGTFEGPFQVIALEYTGAFDGEVAFDIALESAGPLTFT